MFPLFTLANELFNNITK